MSYLVNSSFGPADLERATVPFILACSAANRGPARIFLTGDALHLVVKGNAAGMVAGGYPRLSDLMAEFVDKGGVIWVCKVCAAAMGIAAEDLTKGAEIGGAPNVMDFLEAGGKVLV